MKKTKERQQRSAPLECDVSTEVMARAQTFVADWYANAPHARRAGLMEGLEGFSDLMPRPIDDLTLASRWQCDVENDHHDLGQHEWMRNVKRLARFGARAIALRTLDNFVRMNNMDTIDVRRAAPFEGAATVEAVPTHVSGVLAAIGADEDDYLYLRSRYTEPRRDGATRHERFRREESAKYIRLVHAVGCAINGLIKDPDFGNVPDEATEPAFLDGVDIDKLMEFAASPDGHAFVDADVITEMGFHPDVVATFTREHKSNLSNPMYCIFDGNGDVIESLIAVNELEFLWIVAVEIGADIAEASWKNGRGTQARNLGDAIVTKLTAAAVSISNT